MTVLFYLYIFVMFTFGFWVNFTHFSLFIDIFALALFFAFLKTRKWKISVPLELKSLCILLAVFLFGAMLIAIFCCYSVKMSILGYRDYPTAGVEKTPVAQYMALRVLTLPLYADLPLAAVDKICDVILGD